MLGSSFECSIAHDCKARGVTRCATCELGASHILAKPVQLDCGDMVCKRCTRGAAIVQCKTHGPTNAMLALDTNFSDHKAKILKNMEITLRNALSLRNEAKDSFRKNLRTSVQNVKFEIGSRIEDIKEALDLMRNDLYDDLDDKEENIIKDIESKFNEADVLFKEKMYRESMEDELRGIQNLIDLTLESIQEFYDNPVKIEFNRSEDVTANLIGTISIKENTKTQKEWISCEKEIKEVQCEKVIKYGDNKYVNTLKMVNKEHLASCSWEDGLKLWNLSTGECIAEIDSAASEPSSLALLPNGYLASGGKTHIKIWDLWDSNALVRSFQAHDAHIFCLELVDSQYFISASEDKMLKVWNAKSYEPVWQVNAHKEEVRCLEKLRKGCLATASFDATIKIWSLKDRIQLRSLNGHDNWIRALIVLPNDVLMSGADDKTMRMWNWETGECLRVFHEDDRLREFIVLENGFFGYGLRNGVIKFRHVVDEEKCFTLSAHRDRISEFESLDRERFISTGYDQAIKVWRIGFSEALMDADE